MVRQNDNAEPPTDASGDDQPMEVSTVCIEEGRAHGRGPDVVPTADMMNHCAVKTL